MIFLKITTIYKMGYSPEHGPQGLEWGQTEIGFSVPVARYKRVLKGILGESYEDELFSLLRQRGLIDGHLPQIFLPPDRHEGSKARYLLDFYRGDDRILVPVMGPWKKTSRHSHIEPITEEYEVLKGELSLNGTLIPPEGLIVPPGVLHQVETRDQYALTLIIMRDARLVPESQQHVHS